MAEPFVLIGKAKNVFRQIELKAKREAELKNFMEASRSQVDKESRPIRIINEPRRCVVDGKIRCNVPYGVSCEYIGCGVWKNK